MAIKCFQKNKIDLDEGTLVTITVTDAVATDKGQSFVDYLRNRKNDSGWGTTGSTDAANTQLDVEFGASHEIDHVVLVVHNFKAYTIQYWDGFAWTNFATPISETVNTDDVKHHSFAAVETTKIRIIITAAMVLNADKTLAQLIVTKRIHTFVHEVGVRNLRIGKNRKLLKTNSGKGKVMRSEGAVSLNIVANHVVDLTDLAAVEDLFEYHNGFLVWLCGGTITQYRSSTPRTGWRKKDFYLMSPTNEYAPNWEEGLYENGVAIDIELVETI